MGFDLSQINPQFFDVNPKSEIWNANVHFDDCKTHFIQAASGKGKSTLFSILIGKESDFSGNIFYDEQDLSKISQESLSAFRLKDWSLMLQNLGLFEHLTAKENLEFYVDINADHLSKMELDNMDLNKSCSKFSFGERQRIALLRALSKDFNFIILDEPFSHLNDDLKFKALDLIFDRVKALNASLILFDLDPIVNYKFDHVFQL